MTDDIQAEYEKNIAAVALTTHKNIVAELRVAVRTLRSAERVWREPNTQAATVALLMSRQSGNTLDARIAVHEAEIARLEGRAPQKYASVTDINTDTLGPSAESLVVHGTTDSEKEINAEGEAA